MRAALFAAVALVASAAPIPPADATGGSCYRWVRSDAQRRLVHRESRGNPLARNPKSTAFGCLQTIRATRVRYGRKLGIHPDTTNPRLQLAVGSAYIDDRYGSDERALAHSLRLGWY